MDTLTDIDFLQRVSVTLTAKLLRRYIYDRKCSWLGAYYMRPYITDHQSYQAYMSYWVVSYLDRNYPITPRQTVINVLGVLMYHEYKAATYDHALKYMPAAPLTNIICGYLTTPHITELLRKCQHAMASLQRDNQGVAHAVYRSNLNPVTKPEKQRGPRWRCSKCGWRRHGIKQHEGRDICRNCREKKWPCVYHRKMKMSTLIGP